MCTLPLIDFCWHELIKSNSICAFYYSYFMNNIWFLWKESSNFYSNYNILIVYLYSNRLINLDYNLENYDVFLMKISLKYLLCILCRNRMYALPKYIFPYKVVKKSLTRIDDWWNYILLNMATHSFRIIVRSCL